MTETAVPFDQLRRALVVKLRHHGDVLLTSPLFAALKAAAPGCEIDALVYADTAPLLEAHPAIAQIHRIDRDWKRQGVAAQAIAEWRLLGDLRARNYDLLIHLTEHRRGAWLARLLRPRWSVAPARPERGGLWRNAFTHSFAPPRGRPRHTVERNLDALRVLGLHPAPEQRRLVLVPGAAAAAKVDALLAGHSLPAGGFIHLHPGSRWLFKCWPAEKMAGLVELLNAEGYRLVLTAAPDAREREMIAAIRARSAAPLVDLSGQLSLRELAALTARAKLFIGVDSAPMHIAAAMGTPTVALFGPSGEQEWGPWQVAQRVMVSGHSCRPCGRDGCAGSKVSDCLTTLPVQRVFAACQELLGA
ncbi:MAG: putative lipopolysaccharide heptosyltransferase III [Rhodocyclaceae bacterium]|nr:putative lipopolysaccharide heptosyltransferase III [Rhodocyclaceae bacterium]